MIKGQIAVTWTEQDYKSLPYVDNTDRRGDKSDYAVQTDNYNLAVSSVFENLPGVFHDAVKFLNLQKTVIAINKMTPEQILPFHRDGIHRYGPRVGYLKRKLDV